MCVALCVAQKNGRGVQSNTERLPSPQGKRCQQRKETKISWLCRFLLARIRAVGHNHPSKPKPCLLWCLVTCDVHMLANVSPDLHTEEAMYNAPAGSSSRESHCCQMLPAMLSEPNNNKVDEMVNAGLQNTQYAGMENRTQKAKMSENVKQN